MSEQWRALRAEGFLLSDAEIADLRSVYRSNYREERDLLSHLAQQILEHEFNLLGSGPTQLGEEIDWHLDFKSGRRWPLAPSHTIDYAELSQPSDVKVPWELSRCQHLTRLAQAWVVEGDARYQVEFQRQVTSWIAANPVGLGVNWACTMDVALRAVSWVWALSLFSAAPLPDTFLDEILLSLYRHGMWIANHLEIGEINGNHYISDALGLVVCGTVFRRTKDGRRWLDEGRRMLEREVRLQVGDDGVDFEGSVPYHRLVLEIFLVGERFLAAIGETTSDAYVERLKRMLDFVHSYVTPEGGSPVVGDADDGRALLLGGSEIRDHRYLLSTGCVLFGCGRWKQRAGKLWEDTLWLCGPSAVERFVSLQAQVCEESRAFVNAGFFVFRAPAHYLFVDAGPVGLAGKGGHGHNDCLAFEWHAGGHPIITDSGCFVYTASPEWRNAFRSTAFHSTIRIDNEEVNRFPAPLALWSLRDDAQPNGVRFSPGGERDQLVAGHTGYLRLRQPVAVSRTFTFDRRKALLTINDRIEGTAEHLAEFFFHLAVGAVVERCHAGLVEVSWPGAGRLRIEVEGEQQPTLTIQNGWFAPSYGVRLRRPVIRAALRVTRPAEIAWKLEVAPP